MIETYLNLNGIFSDYSDYSVSNFGNVKTKQGKIMKGTIDKTGYHLVKLTGRTLKKCLRVHRLVAYMFKIDSYSEKLVVNHIDGNKSNNMISNLEWITVAENLSANKVQDKFLKERSERMSLLNKTILRERRMKKVICLETNIQYDSITDAAKAHSLSITTIGRKCKDGIKWKFLD